MAWHSLSDQSRSERASGTYCKTYNYIWNPHFLKNDCVRTCGTHSLGIGYHVTGRTFYCLHYSKISLFKIARLVRFWCSEATIWAYFCATPQLHCIAWNVFCITDKLHKRILSRIDRRVKGDVDRVRLFGPLGCIEQEEKKGLISWDTGDVVSHSLTGDSK